MKDMPAALLVVLSKRDPALFRQVFDRVVDNGRMLRTLLQMSAPASSAARACRTRCSGPSSAG